MGHRTFARADDDGGELRAKYLALFSLLSTADASWITDLNPGQSAFENLDPLRRPHRMIDGEYVPNTNKNADKYRRALPDEVAPCVHTRNDILSSQNTIHPFDDRVFSIAELMQWTVLRTFDGQPWMMQASDPFQKTVDDSGTNHTHGLG